MSRALRLHFVCDEVWRKWFLNRTQHIHCDCGYDASFPDWTPDKDELFKADNGCNLCKKLVEARQSRV